MMTLKVKTQQKSMWRLSDPEGKYPIFIQKNIKKTN